MMLQMLDVLGEMADAIAKNPEGYEEFLRENLLPYVYKKCRGE